MSDHERAIGSTQRAMTPFFSRRAFSSACSDCFAMDACSQEETPRSDAGQSSVDENPTLTWIRRHKLSSDSVPLVRSHVSAHSLPVTQTEETIENVIQIRKVKLKWLPPRVMKPDDVRW